MLSSLLGFFIGFLPGLMGGGGSVMAVPVFIYIFGYDMKTSACMSLVVVGLTSFVGSIRYWRLRYIDLRITVMFGSMAMLGSYAGTELAAFLTNETQLILFAFSILLSSYSMFRGKSEKRIEILHLPILFLGVVVGIVSGVVGVGGGFIIVPTLVFFTNLSMKHAVGTSLAIMSMSTTTGVLGYLQQVSIPWGFTFLFTFLAIIGIFTSTYLVPFIPQKYLKKGFAVFVFIMGLAIITVNF